MERALIVYASKTGTTADVAAEIAGHLTVPAQLYNCRGKADIPAPLREYSLIILGSSIYMGSPLKELKKFAAKHEAELNGVPTALFTCGVGTAEEDGSYLRRHLPAGLAEAAIAYGHMGGEIRPEKMNVLEKLAMKEYQKQHGTAPSIDHEAIRRFCVELNARFGKEREHS